MSSPKLSPVQATDSRRNSPPRTIILLTLAMVILGLAWRIVRFTLHFPLWGDEAFIVANLYHRGFADMFKPLEHAQIAPLAFMWAELAVSRLLGFSVLALRTPAFLCGVFSMLLFWRFARRILDKRAALLAIAIFAASAYVVRHSAEVKPYAQDLAVSLLLLWIAWALYRRSDSVLRWIALILAAALAVWFSYPAVFVVGAATMLLAWGLWRKRSGRLLVWSCVYVLILAGSFLAMYLLFARAHEPSAVGMRLGNTWKGSFPPFTQPWRLPLWFLDIHTGNMMAYPVGGKNFGSTLTFLLVVLGIVTLWRNRQRTLLLLLLGPLPLMLIAAAMKKYPYGTSARVAQHLAPIFCLLAGVGLASALRFWLCRRRPMKGIYIATAVMAAIAIGGMVCDIARPQKKFSDRLNRDALQTLGSWTGPQDKWVIFNALENLPYSPDLHGCGGSAARFRYYIRRFAPANIRWAPPAKDLSPLPAGRTWLIVYRDNKTSFRQDLLDSYLRTARQRLGQSKEPYRFKLTSPKDPTRSQIEAIEVYEFPPLSSSLKYPP